MRSYLAILLLCFAAPAAHAQFHTVVGYKCNEKTDRLVIYYVGAADQSGEEMVKNKSLNEWTPWSLVTMKDDDHIGDLETVVRTCELSHGKYTLRIGPAPGNTNIQGQCGAEMSAWVEVTRDGSIVMPARSFEGVCQSDSVVLVRITFDKGKKEPRLKFVTQNEFWESGGLDP